MQLSPWEEFWEIIGEHQLRIMDVSVWCSISIVAIASYANNPEEFPVEVVNKLKEVIGDD